MKPIDVLFTREVFDLDCPGRKIVECYPEGLRRTIAESVRELPRPAEVRLAIEGNETRIEGRGLTKKDLQDLDREWHSRGFASVVQSGCDAAAATRPLDRELGQAGREASICVPLPGDQRAGER